MTSGSLNAAAFDGATLPLDLLAWPLVAFGRAIFAAFFFAIA
jgi:hypothetical protein